MNLLKTQQAIEKLQAELEKIKAKGTIDYYTIKIHPRMSNMKDVMIPVNEVAVRFGKGEGEGSTHQSFMFRAHWKYFVVFTAGIKELAKRRQLFIGEPDQKDKIIRTKKKK